MMNKETVGLKPSYLHSLGSEPLNPLTIGQLVDIAAEKWKDSECFVSVYQGHRFTYNEIRDKADKLAAGLMQLGLKSGDRLGIWGPSSSEWFISRLAAARGGFIAVQLDPAYVAPQLQFSMNKAEINILIISVSFKSNNYYEMVRTVVPELDNCAEAGTELQCAKVPSLKRILIMSDKQYKGIYCLNDIIDSALPESIKKIRQLQTVIQADDGCCIMFSSGTTGYPKGALLSHHTIINNSKVIGRNANMNQKSITLLLTQFCHISGIIGGILTNLLFGQKTVIVSPVFDPVKALETAITERCTQFIAIPPLYMDLIEKSKQYGLKPTRLEVAIYGGAPCSEQLGKELKEIFNITSLIQVYGMTEMGVTFMNRPEDTLEQRTKTVGKVCDHLEVKVVDREGRIVPMGTSGELWVRGYSIMLKYWNDEKQTHEFMHQNRWARTGDQFILQEDGYGRIVGRIKDCIIRMGDKIFSSEVEDFFTKHPDIIEAQSIGVPDPKIGEEICVYLRLREGVTLTEDNIREYCRDKLPEYRIPRYIRFVKDFPRTAVGKVTKYRLLEELQKESGISK